MSLAGHYWTLSPRFLPLPPEPPSRPWSREVEDPTVGPVRLTGRWSEPPRREDHRPREAVLLLHGIAGCADSRYCRLGAAAALEMGMACLRLNLRGADRQGEDYYHAGLTADLVAALESPELAPYERLHVVGYSLGGHLALRLATEMGNGDGDGASARTLAGRLAGVAGICSPLDLEACQQAFDRPPTAVYRLYVLRGLKQLYAAVAERRPVPLPPREARRIRLLREWDDRVVAPRWGFDGAGDYYARASVAPRLSRLAVPALLVAAEEDPMVPPATLRPILEAADAGSLEVRWLAGAGHLGFPPGLRLDDGNHGGDRGGGESPAATEGWTAARQVGLDAQVLHWLRRHGRPSSTDG